MEMIENQLENISESQEGFIQFVKSNDFPWFFQEGTGQSYNVYAHGLMKRNPIDEQENGIENSTSYVWAYSLFEKFCTDNGVAINKVYRAAFNSTNSADGISGIHCDHEFEHRVFILYLNDCSGSTNIYDSNHVLIKKIKPEKYKGIIFDGLPHNNEPCEVGERRLVMIFTFN
jgi:hypothetical protein